MKAPAPLATKRRPLYVASPKLSRASKRWITPVPRIAAIASHFTVGEGVVTSTSPHMWVGLRLEAALLPQDGQALETEVEELLERSLHPDPCPGGGRTAPFVHDRECACPVRYLVRTQYQHSCRALHLARDAHGLPIVAGGVVEQVADRGNR